MTYKQLVELAYNFHQTDSALSHIFEYNTIKLRNKPNRLRYLSLEHQQVVFVMFFYQLFNF